MPEFNLVDQPWIPCSLAGSGAAVLLGLRDTLARAAEIREVADQSPLITVALHRLLVAIIHRTFGPENSTAWAKIWSRGAFNPDVLEPYLTSHRDRFDLFHDRWPFYQTAGLDFRYAAPVARLAHEHNFDTSNALFNHSVADALAITPAQAARYLVAHQSFAAGGLVSFERPADRSADAAPLTKGAVVLVKGSDLFETLLLNLHRYSPANEEPFATGGDDRPAWERDSETRAEDRRPEGYLDLLTWQSRRIRLQPEAAEDGATVVRKVVIMKGNQFPDGFARHGHETMLAFRKREEAKPGQDPWPAIAFQEDRALWRDSTALFQSIEERQARPKTLEWLNDLVGEGVLDRARVIPLDVTGLCIDRAKVFFWRHERLAVPLTYLGDRDLVDRVRGALDLADRAGQALSQASWVLATSLVSPGSDDSNGRRPAPGDVRAVSDNLAIGRYFWPRLETAFQRLLIGLAADVAATDDGGEYRRGSLRGWYASVGAAAWGAFYQASGGLDPTARTLKAVARAERALREQISGPLARYREHFEKEAVQ